MGDRGVVVTDEVTLLVRRDVWSQNRSRQTCVTSRSNQLVRQGGRVYVYYEDIPAHRSGQQGAARAAARQAAALLGEGRHRGTVVGSHNWTKPALLGLNVEASLVTEVARRPEASAAVARWPPPGGRDACGGSGEDGGRWPLGVSTRRRHEGLGPSSWQAGTVTSVGWDSHLA